MVPSLIRKERASAPLWRFIKITVVDGKRLLSCPAPLCTTYRNMSHNATRAKEETNARLQSTLHIRSSLRQDQPTSCSGRCRPLLSRIPRHPDCQRHTPPTTFPSVTFSRAVLLPRCVGANLAPSWAREAPQVVVVGVRVAFAVASTDRKFGRRSHIETKFDRQHVLLFFPSLSQQWACIVINVTNVSSSSAYVCHTDHTVTEVSLSDVPQHLTHHTNLQLRTELNLSTQRHERQCASIKRAVRSGRCTFMAAPRGEVR